MLIAHYFETNLEDVLMFIKAQTKIRVRKETNKDSTDMNLFSLLLYLFTQKKLAHQNVGKGKNDGINQVIYVFLD